MQLKYSNYVAFSHFHGEAVNNIGLIFKDIYPACIQVQAETNPCLEDDGSNH